MQPPLVSSLALPVGFKKRAPTKQTYFSSLSSQSQSSVIQEGGVRGTHFAIKDTPPKTWAPRGKGTLPMQASHFREEIYKVLIYKYLHFNKICHHYFKSFKNLLRLHNCNII